MHESRSGYSGHVGSHVSGAYEIKVKWLLSLQNSGKLDAAIDSALRMIVKFTAALFRRRALQASHGCAHRFLVGGIGPGGWDGGRILVSQG